MSPCSNPPELKLNISQKSSIVVGSKTSARGRNGEQELQETLEEWERAVYQTQAEDKPREDGSVAHRPPEGRAGHRAGG